MPSVDAAWDESVDLMAPEVEWHDTPDLPGARRYLGREGVLAAGEKWRRPSTLSPRSRTAHRRRRPSGCVLTSRGRGASAAWRSRARSPRSARCGTGRSSRSSASQPCGGPRSRGAVGGLGPFFRAFFRALGVFRAAKGETSTQRASTEPKVTGSNPVGRARAVAGFPAPQGRSRREGRLSTHPPDAA